MSASPPARSLPRPLRWSKIILGIVVAALAGGASYWVMMRASHPTDSQPPRPDDPANPAAETGPLWFQPMTAGSGIDFTNSTGADADQFTILETLGGGVALFDYDRDGRLDVFLAGGGYFDGPKKEEIKGRPCRLYRNLGGWKFEDVTQKVGLERTWWYTHGVAVADYDRDGWPDFVVTGYGRLALFHNEPDGAGGRKFVDVSEPMGLRDNSWSTSAAWGDLDGDGFPDLYVCHYVDWSFANHPICPGLIPGIPRDVCPPQRFKPLVHAAFRNEKGKGFRDVSAELGFQATGGGLGVAMADLNDDRRPDIYVANDASNNFLYFNRGGWKLEERGLEAGVAVDDSGRYNGSMGTDVGEYDGSGRPSIWVANFQGDLHALYLNLGRETFQHQSRAAGIAAIGTHLVGFGTGFLDIDNDGWEDLALVNGHVLRHPLIGATHEQKPVLLRNVARQGRRMFEDASGRGGEFFRTPALGRGLAIGDLDNDGWPDLVVSHSDTPVALLRNIAGESAPNTRWVGVQLVGRDRRDIVGSTVILDGSTRRSTRFVKGGGSYLSAGDSRLLFGLGSAEQIRKITINWSWGDSQSWEHLDANAYWELTEGQAAPARLTAPRP